MDINWLGHSCFRLKGSQRVVITDPYSPEIGYTLGKQSAAIITVSHQHPGHSFVAGISDNPRVIKGPGEYEVAGTLIIGLATFHDREEGRARGKNTVYVIQLDELSVCHLGDIGHPLTARQIEEIGNVDILLVPVGGMSTINATTAAEVVRQLEPRLVIPMHFKTPVVNKDLEPIDRFLKEMGVKDAATRPRLVVTKNNLPAGMQVVLLDY